MEIAVAEQQRVILLPVVAFSENLPVFAGRDHVIGVIAVEDAVAPVIDLEQETRKTRIFDSRSVDMESVVPQLFYPVSIGMSDAVGSCRRHSGAVGDTGEAVGRGLDGARVERCRA